MSRYALVAFLANLLLAGCNRTATPAVGAMPDGKPALVSPPGSMMTPQGY
jgi:hypothetical protein